MTFTPLENALLELFDQIPSETIAIRAQVSQALASSALDSVKQKVIQRHDKDGEKWDVPTTAEVYSVIDTAVRNVDDRRLADEKETTVDAIRRTLSCVLDQTQRLQARSSGSGRRASNIQPLLGQTVPTSHLGDIRWPATVSEHASMLKQAHTTVFEKRERYDDHSVIISLKDLETLLFGSTLLDLRVNEVYKTLISKVPPRARGSFELDMSHRGEASVGEGAKAVQQFKKMVTNKAELGRVRPPPIVTSGIPLMAKSPHIEIVNHTAQPIFPAKAPAPPILPLREENNQQKPRLLAAPPRASSMPSLNHTRKTIVTKHSLIRSPGQSPKKKKTKALRKSLPIPKVAIPKKPKKPLNEYLIWTKVERKRLGAEGHVSSKHLSKIWDNMTAEEKAPFTALKQSDQARWRAQGKQLERGGSIDPLLDEQYWNEFWDHAQAVPRSEAASNAALYMPQSSEPDRKEAVAEQGQDKGGKDKRAKHTDEDKDSKEKHVKHTDEDQATGTEQDKVGEASKPQASQSKRTKSAERKSLAITQAPMPFPHRATLLRPSSAPTHDPPSPNNVSTPKHAGPYFSASRMLMPPVTSHPLRRMPAMHFQPPRSSFVPFAGDKSEDLLVRLRRSNARLNAALASPSPWAGGSALVKDVVKGGAGATLELVEVVDLGSGSDEVVSDGKSAVEQLDAPVAAGEVESSEKRSGKAGVGRQVLSEQTVGIGDECEKKDTA